MANWLAHSLHAFKGLHMNRKTVFTQGNIIIVRVQDYGFRCNTLSSSWEIFVDGKFRWTFSRLKDAKKTIAQNLIPN
jgi:hypothetical protein